MIKPFVSTRGGGLLVVALLHLLAIYFVTRPRMQSAPVVAARRSEIVFLTSPAPRRTAAPTQRPTPKPTLTLTPISAGANQRPPVAASSAREPAQRPPQPITLVAPATEAPPVANSPAPVEPDWTQPVARQGADSLAERAKKSVGAIDRDLRNKSLNMSDRKPAAEQTALARNVASAFKTQNTTIEEILMADGRRMSKIHTPHGSYCAYMESNAITGGRDPFKDGVRTKISNCTR